MGKNPKLVTTMSTKGQVILPKAIRSRKHWHSGTRFVVEETAEGVILKPFSPFSPTRPEDVFGCAAYEGPPQTIEEMDQAIMDEARRRHARGRY